MESICRRSNNTQLSFSRSRRGASERRAPRLTPTHSGLSKTGMHDLFMCTFNGSTADPISQPQILVVVHATGVLAVIMDQRIQTRAQLRRLRSKTFQPCDDLLDLSSFEIAGDLVDPLIGLLRSFAVAQTGEVPGVLQGVPEIEDFATVDKPCGPVPDPLRPIAHDHHHGVGAEPAQFPQLRIEPVEDRIGVSQTTDQEAPHHRAAARRCFNTLFGQQQNPVLTSRK